MLAAPRQLQHTNTPPATRISAQGDSTNTCLSNRALHWCAAAKASSSTPHNRSICCCATNRRHTDTANTDSKAVGAWQQHNSTPSTAYQFSTTAQTDSTETGLSNAALLCCRSGMHAAKAHSRSVQQFIMRPRDQLAPPRYNRASGQAVRAGKHHRGSCSATHRLQPVSRPRQTAQPQACPIEHCICVLLPVHQTALRITDR
jgi:hypothetical protein